MSDEPMLVDKAVVVTGAGHGIGAAYARGIARQGGRVIVNDIDEETAVAVAEEITAAGGTAISHVADVTDWDQAGAMIDRCISEFGRIDGLVNNAGLTVVMPVSQFDPQAARAEIEVNIIGPMNGIGHAVKPMLAQGSGSIVNVTSGAHMGMPSLGVYGATKGAIASLTYTWSMELAGSGVRMNAISPFGDTGIVANTVRHLKKYYGIERPNAPTRHNDLEMQPASANSPIVEFLLSDAAAGINGQLVRIDRGEMSLYTHPALLQPSARSDSWDAHLVAQTFADDFAARQVASGVLGMTSLPVPLSTGFWAEAKPRQP